MKCQKCGAELENGVLFCRECGNKVEKQVCFCRECGSKVDGGSKFCSNCGAKVEIQAASVEPVHTNLNAEEVPTAKPVVEKNYTPDTKIAAKQEDSLGDKLKTKIAALWGKLSLYGKFTTIVIGIFSLMCLVAFLAGKTLAGVIALVAVALVVVALLMKKQIIKSPKSWLHFVALALAVVMIVPYVSVFRIDYGDAEKFQWSDVVLSDVIPEPNPLFGEVVSNADDYLSLYIYKIDQSDYDTYVAACKAQGFTIDSDEGDRSYYAYNAAGYKLSLYFYESDGKMHIGVDAAEEYGVLEWSASEIASLLPVPESTTGEITQDDEKGFSAYVSNTSTDAYKAYVTACVNMGFDVDANDTDKHYSAQNADGYKLSIDYQGNNVIYISLDVPEYEVTVEVECVENWIFSKYDVDVYVNEYFEGTITHGETETFELTLTKGSYELKFVSNEDDNATGVVTINIQKAESLKYKISCHSSNIDVETIVGTDSGSNDDSTEPDDTTSSQPSVETTMPEETTQPEVTTAPEAISIVMTVDSATYAGKTAADVEAEFKGMGFTNVNIKQVATTDTTNVEGQVTSVSANESSFKKGDEFQTDALINIYCWKVEAPVSEYELAFVRKLSNYSLYYMFDTDTKTVVQFGTDDTYLYRGSYTGDFSTGVTMTWDHGEWTDEFTYREGSSKATYTDGYGSDWDYTVCDLKTAQDLLDTRER